MQSRPEISCHGMMSVPQGGGLSKSTSFNGGMVVLFFIFNRNSTMVLFRWSNEQNLKFRKSTRYYLGGLMSKIQNFEKVPGTISVV